MSSAASSSPESAPSLLILYCAPPCLVVDEMRLLEIGDSALSSALPESPSHGLIWVAKGLCRPPYLGLLGDPLALVNRHLLGGVMCSMTGVSSVMR